MDVKPYYGMSRRCYLQELQNKFGDFRVAIGWINKETGELIWSKHRSVLSCWESEEGLEFLDRVNNRTAFETEIRIDTDPKKDETAEQALKKFNDVCDKLESFGIKSYQGYFSGSRGYHIHLRSNDFLNNNKKWEIKQAFIDVFGGDLLKASDNTMLTLEWSPNNKTGKPKVPIRGVFDEFD